MHLTLGWVGAERGGGACKVLSPSSSLCTLRSRVQPEEERTTVTPRKNASEVQVATMPSSPPKTGVGVGGGVQSEQGSEVAINLVSTFGEGAVV